MSAVPVLKDEIERKSFEAIDFLITKLNIGAITPHQFGTGVDVLWMACSGLVSENVIDLITAGGNAAPIKSPIEKRVFINGARTAVVQRTVGDDFLDVTIYEAGLQAHAKRKDCGGSAAARDAIISTAAKLLATGYTEI